MKMFAAVLTSAVFAALAVAPVHAQQPEALRDLHHPEPPAAAPAPTPGMKGAGMPMMDMCHQMMGDPMGMPMMGGTAPADAKDRADMLHMRGEMLKAMGEVMMNHARRMQEGPGK